jgi:DNA polymerase delta subunit 1
MEEDGEGNHLVFQCLTWEPAADEVNPNQFAVFGMGKTQEGRSVCCLVRNYAARLYIDLSGMMSRFPAISDIESLANKIERQVLWSRGYLKDTFDGSSVVYKKRFRGDDETAYPFLEIRSKSSLRRLAISLAKFGLTFYKRRDDPDGANIVLDLSRSVYEGKLDPTMQFFHEQEIRPAGWVSVDLNHDKVEVVRQVDRVSLCDVELVVNDPRAVAPHTEKNRLRDMAPFKIISFDVEAWKAGGKFPSPGDPGTVCYMICAQVDIGKGVPRRNHVFSMKECSELREEKTHGLNQVTIHQENDDEKAMLSEFLAFLSVQQPDVLIGYNILKYDLPLIYHRCVEYGLADIMEGALKFQEVPKLDSDRQYWKDNPRGYQEYEEVRTPGVLQLDIFKAVQIGYTLDSYTLRFVGNHFLKDISKLDLSYEEQFRLFEAGTPDGMRCLAEYCLVDAAVPFRLMDHLKLFLNFVEMANLTRVQVTDLVTKGQSQKAMSQIAHDAHEEDYLLPDEFYERRHYLGGKVLDSKSGVYGMPRAARCIGKGVNLECKCVHCMNDTPIATLDFTSLYPSIMIANNLCYTTLVTDDRRRDPKEKYNTWEWKDSAGTHRHTFCQTRQGVLPRLVQRLLAARKAVKGQMKALEFGSYEYAIRDAQQQQLKLSGNSIYGFTGATGFPCIPVAETVTYIGRTMIEKIASWTEAGLDSRGKERRVIAGDTDSIMVAYDTRHLKTMEDKVAFCVQESNRDAENLTKRLRAEYKFLKPEDNPVHLKYEKVTYPYMCIEQKNYMGYIQHPVKEAGPDIKGRVKKRDLCPYVRKMAMDAVMTLLEPGMPVDKAKALVQDRLNAFLEGKVPKDEIIMTKRLKSTWQEYYFDTAGNPVEDHGSVHAKLAQRMFERDPGTAPGKGDRVQYMYGIMPRLILGKTGKGEAGHVETPEYMEKHNIQVDYSHYVDKQFHNIIEYIFKYVVDEPIEFLDPTRNKTLRVERERVAMNSGRQMNGKIMEDFFSRKRRADELPASVKETYKTLLEEGIVIDQADIDAMEEVRKEMHQPAAKRVKAGGEGTRMAEDQGKVKMFMLDTREDDLY